MAKLPGAGSALHVSGGLKLEQPGFFLAVLCCALPILLPHYPPAIDLPQHAAQVASVKAYLQGSWPFADQFELKPFTPYWLGYGLILLLSGLTGVVWATKLVLAASAVGMVLAAARLCRVMGADPRWNWLLLLLPFGFAYQWGFLNFYVALPFGLWLLARVLDRGERGGWRGAFGLLLWVHFLFFAHILVAGYFCAMALLLLPARSWRTWLVQAAPILGVLPVTLAWVWGTVGVYQSGLALTDWAISWDRLANLLPDLVGLYGPWRPLGVVVGLMALAVPVLTGGRLLAERRRLLPLAAHLLVVLFLPSHVFGNSYTYERFAALGLVFYLLCFVPGPPPSARRHLRLATAGAAVLALAMLGMRIVDALRFDADTRAYSNVIAQAEPGRRMLMLMIARKDESSGQPLYLHFPAWYQAENNGLVEFSFSRFGVTPLHYRDPSSSGVLIGFEWVPYSLDWTRHRGWLYDYVIVRSPTDESGPLYGISGCALVLIASQGPWQLYGRVRPELHPDPRCSAG